MTAHEAPLPAQPQARADRWPRWIKRRALGVSLHRQLLLWLVLPQLVLWGAAAWISYHTAVRHANRAIDAGLSQATRSLARQVKPIGNGLFIDFPRAAQDIIEADPADRAFYMVSSPPGLFILGNRMLPPPPASLGTPDIGETVFYDGTMALAPESASADRPENLPVRVAALYLAYGEEDHPQTMLVQLARSSAGRGTLAREILLDTALPLSGLILLMTLIVWAGIRAGLAPLARLRDQVQDRAADHLAPLSVDAAPQEVRALARALNSLLAAVQHNVQSQKRFISDAAHQLRTPLAGLKSQTELALQDLGDPRGLQDPAIAAEAHRRLQLVQQSAARSAHLVNQLLTLARTEPESAEHQARSPVQVGRLAREVTAEMVPRARAAGIDLGTEESRGGEDLTIEGIELLLREALGNLIDNAIRYSGRGAEVTVRWLQEGGEAVIEVEDSGPGLSEADRERVFERFVRATHEGTGCGLGLAIVREVIERHGGRVRLREHLPRGLVAEVRLPALPVQ